MVARVRSGGRAWPGYRWSQTPACSRQKWRESTAKGGRLTRRFRNLRPAKANAFKCTSSRRLLTAGYPATAATRVNFRETTIVWRCRFRLAAASPHPDEHRGRSGLQKPIGFFRPDSRVACASLRRLELAPRTKAAKPAASSQRKTKQADESEIRRAQEDSFREEQEAQEAKRHEME